MGPPVSRQRLEVVETQETIRRNVTGQHPPDNVRKIVGLQSSTGLLHRDVLLRASTVPAGKAVFKASERPNICRTPPASFPSASLSTGFDSIAQIASRASTS